jgi:DNA-directed RNA polymerase specialized sigma24 family protein
MKLHIDQGLPVEDVASALGISVQNAYTVKHRAIQRLRAYVVSVIE